MERVGFNKPTIAGDLDQATTHAGEYRFRGLHQRPANSKPSGRGIHHECGDAANRVRPMEHGHAMQRRRAGKGYFVPPLAALLDHDLRGYRVGDEALVVCHVMKSRYLVRRGYGVAPAYHRAQSDPADPELPTAVRRHDSLRRITIAVDNQTLL